MTGRARLSAVLLGSFVLTSCAGAPVPAPPGAAPSATAQAAPRTSAPAGERRAEFSHSGFRGEVYGFPFGDKGLREACLQGSMAIFAYLDSCSTARGSEERINESLVYLGCTGSPARAGDRNARFYVTSARGARWVLDAGYSFERGQYSILMSPYSATR